ncbi:MAG: LacI family DNA-binding transcriptional regulator [Lachnospiraceae bacterium]|nr:LacI family DNA-binding transcriptional regulator [Lachnospiraceae bacterium]MDD3660579.1 LacI family DNA-binding transcriptional regulator [Lachnospiraceae bacterium]
MVSMKDISIACGVSIATVSKAINGHKDIGEDTRAYIKKTAKEMGYFPNSSARALKTNKSYNLGVLFADDSRSGLTHDHFANVLDSFKVTAEGKGYDITFLNCNKKRKDRMSYLEHSMYRGFDGVVIACVDFYDPEVIELVNSKIPVVTLDHLFNNRIAIVSNHIKGMSDLVNYVYSKGHRKIAYIHGADSSVTRSRLASFYKTTEELGLIIPDEYMKEIVYRDTVKAGIMTEELLQLKEPPTCILYADDFSALGGMNVIKSHGMSIPDDISIAGYDGINISTSLEPQLTTIKQNTKLLGKIAAEKLISIIEKPKTTIVEPIVIEGTLMEGRSVKAI